MLYNQRIFRFHSKLQTKNYYLPLYLKRLNLDSILAKGKEEEQKKASDSGHRKKTHKGLVTEEIEMLKVVLYLVCCKDRESEREGREKEEEEEACQSTRYILPAVD
jgi:hypothetical protein